MVLNILLSLDKRTVGGIMMIAIVGILAGAIGTYVIGFGGVEDQKPQAGVEVVQNDDNTSIDVQVNSLTNADSVRIVDNDTNVTSISRVDGSTSFDPLYESGSYDGTVTVIAESEGDENVAQRFDYDIEAPMEQNPQAGIDISQNETAVTVQVISLADADAVDVEWEDESGSAQSTTLNSVGETTTITVSTNEGDVPVGNTVKSIATVDGNRNVVQEYTVD